MAKSAPTPQIEFDCAVAKVQTLADGGIRVTLDLSEQDTAIAKTLMDLRAAVLRVSIAETQKISRKKINNAISDLEHAEAAALADI